MIASSSSTVSVIRSWMPTTASRKSSGEVGLAACSESSSKPPANEVVTSWTSAEYSSAVSSVSLELLVGRGAVVAATGDEQQRRQYREEPE